MVARGPAEPLAARRSWLGPVRRDCPHARALFSDWAGTVAAGLDSGLSVGFRVSPGIDLRQETVRRSAREGALTLARPGSTMRALWRVPAGFGPIAEEALRAADDRRAHLAVAGDAG